MNIVWSSFHSGRFFHENSISRHSVACSFERRLPPRARVNESERRVSIRLDAASSSSSSWKSPLPCPAAKLLLLRCREGGQKLAPGLEFRPWIWPKLPPSLPLSVVRPSLLTDYSCKSRGPRAKSGQAMHAFLLRPGNAARDAGLSGVSSLRNHLTRPHPNLRNRAQVGMPLSRGLCVCAWPLCRLTQPLPPPPSDFSNHFAFSQSLTVYERENTSLRSPLSLSLSPRPAAKATDNCREAASTKPPPPTTTTTTTTAIPPPTSNALLLLPVREDCVCGGVYVCVCLYAMRIETWTK